MSISLTAVGRSATRYHVSISPLPLTVIVPRGSQTKSSLISSYVSRVIWIQPGVPCDSIRLAVFTASPHASMLYSDSMPASTGQPLASTD